MWCQESSGGNHRVDITECALYQFPSWVFNFWQWAAHGSKGKKKSSIMNFFIDTDRASLPNKGTISAVSSAGWAVADLTETTGTKFFVEFTGSITDNVITEILIGKKL